MRSNSHLPEKRARPSLFILAAPIALAALTGACAGKAPEPVMGPPPEVLFPWPAGLQAATDPECKAAEGAVREGFALEDDLWIAVLCISERLPPENMDAFVARLRQFRRDSTGFRTVPRERLPANVRARAPDAPVVSVYVSDEKRREMPALRPHLFAGGWRSICLPWTQEGHYQATDRAVLGLNQFGFSFSDRARRLIADASQDPDLFDWDTMEAHSQSRLAGEAPQDRQAAMEKVQAFVSGHVHRAASACARGTDAGVQEALYFTGYALHAIQDLAPHRGRTNEEHAFNVYEEGRNPDAEPAALTLATDLTITALRRWLAEALRGCRDAFGRYDGPTLSYPDKLERFQLTRDFTIAAFRSYREGRRGFVKEAPGSRVRWFGQVHTPRRCVEDPDCSSVMDFITR
jgi:hypothetical protein